MFSSLLGLLGRTLPGTFGLASWVDASSFMCWVPKGMLCFLWSFHDGQQLHDEADVMSVCCFFRMRQVDVATWPKHPGVYDCLLGSSSTWRVERQVTRSRGPGEAGVRDPRTPIPKTPEQPQEAASFYWQFFLDAAKTFLTRAEPPWQLLFSFSLPWLSSSCLHFPLLRLSVKSSWLVLIQVTGHLNVGHVGRRLLVNLMII